jgi:hypothetical protein
VLCIAIHSSINPLRQEAKQPLFRLDMGPACCFSARGVKHARILYVIRAVVVR